MGGPGAPASFVTFAAADPQVLYYHALAVEEAHFRLYRLSDSEAEILLRRGFIDGWREERRVDHLLAGQRTDTQLDRADRRGAA